ncbi:hypothetical protein CYLTODRAFT_262187 [Cylindrobasidium torrendii FP15055 ss-10]|uniref:Uncharacterized protein n=1 Tax=Cylindrobasidium torrendii FP15055 ss-10 TaxID=1314674 RepID=A0A0D7BE33_9AGAR|nr:hypothetical protein CYLTODRAFT_262187 [Cylindrobasidium torrendii FP15055 ss-10]
MLDTSAYYPQDYSDQLAKASDEIQALKDELKTQSDNFQRYVHELDQYYRNEQAASSNEYQNALDAAQSRIQVLERQFNGEHDRRQKAESLLDIRRHELQEAQVYLEKSDTMSGHDIVGLVKAVNAEIFQLAASISESAPRQEHIHCPRPSSDGVQELIGANFLAVLRIESLPNWDAEILLQTAVQTALVKIVHRWNMFYTINGVQGGLISAYKNIRASSPQSVSSRWRALVYSRYKYVDTAAALDKLRLLLHTSLTTVITYLGHSMPQVDLTPLAEAVIKADRAAVEGVLSQSMVFALIDGGKAFDKQTMADADGGRGSVEKKDRTVACCIEAGVHCTVRGDTGTIMSRQWILKPKQKQRVCGVVSSGAQVCIPSADSPPR